MGSENPNSGPHVCTALYPGGHFPSPQALFLLHLYNPISHLPPISGERYMSDSLGSIFNLKCFLSYLFRS